MDTIVLTLMFDCADMMMMMLALIWSEIRTLVNLYSNTAEIVLFFDEIVAQEYRFNVIMIVKFVLS